MDVNGPEPPGPLPSPQAPGLDPHPRRLPPRTAAVVIDMGTGTCKMGFAGQAQPACTVATVLGCGPRSPAGPRQPALETLFGEAARARPELRLLQPVRAGIVQDWEAAELLWRHVLEHDLRVDPRDRPLLFSDPPFSPATNREQLAETAFEALRCPAAFVASQAVLSVYAHGRVSGLVVDAGHGVSCAAPVFQGHTLPHAVERLDLAGSHLTAFLAEALRSAGWALGPRDLDAVERIKRRHCYVAPDFLELQARPDAQSRLSVQLPDGRALTLGEELFQGPELLFRPPQAPGLPPAGLPALAARSLRKLPPEARAPVAQRVLLCGGSSLLAGFEGRFRTELLRSLPPDVEAETEACAAVVAAPGRGLSVWIGGSVLASLSAFQSCWVLREQYEEQGPHVVYSKCY
ncbi:actin-like protein 9 [Heterocephalus glaber]|uniref:Actin-like protein 9 n=1 Tax=Heterocephalus glaber TaxID=10181 RepID=A0AAX6Q1T0_HETGA|nr:actin-like protein 9 [Heterocephalus glaber]